MQVIVHKVAVDSRAVCPCRIVGRDGLFQILVGLLTVEICSSVQLANVNERVVLPLANKS